MRSPTNRRERPRLRHRFLQQGGHRRTVGNALGCDIEFVAEYYVYIAEGFIAVYYMYIIMEFIDEYYMCIIMEFRRAYICRGSSTSSRGAFTRTP